MSAPLQTSDPAPGERTIPDWYRPGKSISEFHASPAAVRALIGGRGTGKTTAIAVETLGHGWHNAGAKIYILRKTQDSNQDTTLDTFEQVFANAGTAYRDTGASLFRKIEGGKQFRIPSKMAVTLFNQFLKTQPTKAQTLRWLDTVGARYCSWICFAGVPHRAMAATRFRGYECSMLIFVEADQLDHEDLELGVACLRWKGADPEVCDANGFIRDTCTILDTNPPSPRHWIAKMEKELEQVPDANVRFWHVPTSENAHNLPPGYEAMLRRTYARNAAMLQRMVMGQYAEAFDGKPVLWAFRDDLHAAVDLPWPQHAYLVRSWDFGTSQSVIFSAYWEHEGHEYWWDLQEFYAEQSDVERQCLAVRDITEAAFPFWNDREMCSGVRDFCDVAGIQKKDTGSSIATLRSHGFYPGYSRMKLQDSLTIYNRLLQRTDRAGQHIYRIDRKGCERLYLASLGGYRYPSAGEAGHGSDLPYKDGTFDHLADASRYGKMNCMRICKELGEESKRAVGKLAMRKNLNRKRDW